MAARGGSVLRWRLRRTYFDIKPRTARPPRAWKIVQAQVDRPLRYLPVRLAPMPENKCGCAATLRRCYLQNCFLQFLHINRFSEMSGKTGATAALHEIGRASCRERVC